MNDNTEVTNELVETTDESLVVEEQVEQEEAVEQEEVTEEAADKVDLTPEQQKKFNEQYFLAKQKEREADALRKELEALKTKPSVAAEEERDLASFDFDDAAYQDYIIDQKVELKLAAQAQKFASEAANKTKQEAANTINEAFNLKATEYANTNPSYNEAIANAQYVQYSPTLSEAVLHEGPALDHHLLTNPQLVDKLNGLTGYALVREVSTIVGNLNKTASARISKAPTPPPTVSGGSRATKDVTDPNISMADYYAAEMDRMSKKR